VGTFNAPLLVNRTPEEFKKRLKCMDCICVSTACPFLFNCVLSPCYVNDDQEEIRLDVAFNGLCLLNEIRYLHRTA
jgi:hypothetical protein